MGDAISTLLGAPPAPQRELRMLGAALLALTLLAPTACDDEADADADSDVDGDVDGDGDADGDGDTDADGDGDSDGDADGDSASLVGTVTLAEDLFPPLRGDLAGPLMVAVLDPAALTGSEPPIPVVSQMLEVDLAEPGWSVGYRLEEVPLGSWILVALFDKDGDLDPLVGPAAGDVLSPFTEVVVVPGENRQDLVLSSTEPAPQYCGQTPLDAEERACVFDFVWSFAERNYMCFEAKDIDWDAARETYEPLAEAAVDEAEFFLVMQQLVTELKDYHSSLLGMPLIDVVGHCPALDVRLIGGTPYVVGVSPEAAELGLAVGDRITAVDGRTAAEQLEAWARIYSRHHPEHFDYVIGPVFLCGPEGPVTFTVEQAGGPLEVTLERSEFAGDELSQALLPREGLLSPEELLEDRELTLEDGQSVGYLRIKTFAVDIENAEALVRTFDEALERYRSADALVLDVRGNPGGTVSAVLDVVARLVDAQTLVFRQVVLGVPGEAPISVEPRGEWQFTGPMVVLIDEASYSCATVFAAAMEAIDRTVVVGRPTGGGMSEAILMGYPLTDNSALMMSGQSVFLSSTDFGAEIVGVVPDVAVPLTLEDVLAGVAYGYGEEGDPGLEAALDVILGLR